MVMLTRFGVRVYFDKRAFHYIMGIGQAYDGRLVPDYHRAGKRRANGTNGGNSDGRL